MVDHIEGTGPNGLKPDAPLATQKELGKEALGLWKDLGSKVGVVDEDEIYAKSLNETLPAFNSPMNKTQQTGFKRAKARYTDTMIPIKQLVRTLSKDNGYTESINGIKMRSPLSVESLYYFDNPNPLTRGEQSAVEIKNQGANAQDVYYNPSAGLMSDFVVCKLLTTPEQCVQYENCGWCQSPRSCVSGYDKRPSINQKCDTGAYTYHAIDLKLPFEESIVKDPNLSWFAKK